jgi:hypothetical protein
MTTETIPRARHTDLPPVTPDEPAWADVVAEQPGWPEHIEPEADLQRSWQAFVAWADPTPWWQMPLLWIAFMVGTVVRWLRA